MCWIKNSFAPEVFWVMVTALFTVGIFAVAWIQLRALARTSRTDLLYRLRKDFFSQDNRTITFHLDNDLLEFNPGPPACFDVKKGGPVEGTMDSIITQWIDDYVGILEDIAGLWKANDFSLVEVYHSFGYYVTLVCENDAIEAYVVWVRAQEGKAGRDIYEDLFDMYNAIKKLEKE